jgi:hypothetical protein
VKLYDAQPSLADTSCTVTSPATAQYNCVAWAANDDRRVWAPVAGPGGKLLGGYHWPESVPLRPSVQALEEVFRLLGYSRCDDGQLVKGLEKIVIYGDELGEGKHVARQTKSGKWTSKMGVLADIEHDQPEEIESVMVGSVISYMSRKVRQMTLSEPVTAPRLLLPGPRPD